MHVIDASVMIKWALEETGRHESLVLLDAFEAGEIDIVAPRLLPEELASALSKRCRRKQITRYQAETAFEFLEQRMPLLIGSPELTTQALHLSLSNQLGFWDCLYLALAARYRCDLVTADRRFHRAVQHRYPFVVLLGA